VASRQLFLSSFSQGAEESGGELAGQDTLCEKGGQCPSGDGKETFLNPLGDIKSRWTSVPVISAFKVLNSSSAESSLMASAGLSGMLKSGRTSVTLFSQLCRGMESISLSFFDE